MQGKLNVLIRVWTNATMTHILSIKTRNYSAWEWTAIDQHKMTQQLPTHMTPITERLFDGDSYCADTNQILYTAPIRTDPVIPGVLILEGNRTYGRQKLASKGKSMQIGRAHV